jgi:hypothetical protein
VIRNLILSSSKEDDDEEGVVKWNKDVTVDDLLDSRCNKMQSSQRPSPQGSAGS